MLPVILDTEYDADSGLPALVVHPICRNNLKCARGAVFYGFLMLYY
jgi:hypothetical protein